MKMRLKSVTTMVMLVAIVVMSSCSRQDDLPQTSGERVRLTLNAQHPDVQTRAVSDIKRYVLEVYRKGESLTPANAFTDGSGAPTHHCEQATGNFTMELEKNVEYIFLVWADNSDPGDNTNGFYNAANLRAVKMNEAAALRNEGFCAVLTQKATSSMSLPIPLVHAVAKFVYENTDPLTEENNKLTVVYPITSTLNLANGEIAATPTPITRTFEGIGKEKGIIATDYIFAPVTEVQLTVILLSINNESQRVINNIPIQVNYVTNIKGEFSRLTQKGFNITTNDSWDVMDIELNAAEFTNDELKTKLTITTAKRWTVNGTATSDGFSIPSVVSFALNVENNTSPKIITLNDVTNIAAMAFNGRTNLLSIFMPEVTTIGENGFRGCSKLEFVDIPKATTIGTWAFAECGALQSVGFNKSISSWGFDVFMGTTTENMVLVLKKGQRQPVGGDVSDWNSACTGAEVEEGPGKQFAGYTFKAILLVN